MGDALVVALTDSLCVWTGADQLRIDLEGHGREELSGNEDVTRTIGWFTTLYPVFVEAAARGSGSEAETGQGRIAPHPTAGSWIWAIAGPHDKKGAAALPAGGSEVLFNYVGQLDWETGKDGWLRMAQIGGADTK